MTSDKQSAVAEARQTLWMLVISPGIWGAHFLGSYAAAAVWCGVPVRVGIVAAAALAISAIAWNGLRGWRMHSYGESDGPPHDRDTDADRHRFLGFATALLSGLSAVATAYAALAATLSGGCGA